MTPAEIWALTDEILRLEGEVCRLTEELKEAHACVCQSYKGTTCASLLARIAELEERLTYRHSAGNIS